ncbi:MAG TPA: efflux RND transporter periplasmic adaptor subunit [Thermoanaerobaculia bacterium]|nr:efflux RND transporter periplasmic adaptor subunit [Thermoanaerobaculia bacterium]
MKTHEPHRRLTLPSAWLRSIGFVGFLCGGCAQAPAPPPEEAPAAPVRLETAKRETFQPELLVLGTVQPGGMAEVTVPTAGRVLYPARFAGGLIAGAEVRAGEVLARISFGDADADLAEARLRVKTAESEVARHQRAFDAGVEAAVILASFKADLELARSRLSAAENRLGRLSLSAPLSGRLIVDRRIAPQSEVTAGTVLGRIAAAGALSVEGRAAAADRDRLHAGLAVRFGSEGHEAGAGSVREVAPVVDAGGTVKLIVAVDDPAGLPGPGEGVEVRVALDRHEQALTVPEEALVVAESGSALFIARRGQGHLIAHRESVETGARGGGRVEILRGLSPGDKVVVGGAALLAEGDPIAAIEANEGEGSEAAATAAGEEAGAAQK